MIELKDICKTFYVSRRDAGVAAAVKSLFHPKREKIEALKNISFTIGDGEIVGYIGPNGAGKSSTIKIMSGILTPDSGTCCISGRTPWKKRTQHVQDIGVVFGQRSQLWWDVPVIDSFQLLRDIYGVDACEYRRNLAVLVELLDLSELIRTPARMLSLGQRMRCEFAASLLPSPKILFLDEPTIGLDAVSKVAIRSFVRQINREQGTTIILTTHDMQDIEALASRVLLIGKGQILLDGTLDDLKQKHAARKTLTVIYTGPEPVLSQGLYLIDRLPGRAVIGVDPAFFTMHQAIGAIAERTDIQDITVNDAGLDDLILSLYRAYHI